MGTILVILGNLFSVVPIYGWGLGALVGVFGLILSLQIQQIEVAKTYALTHTTDSLLVKDRVDIRKVKEEESGKE